MEGIKEQDSEQEVNVSKEPVSAPAPHQTKRVAFYEDIQRKISEAQAKQYSVRTKLNRMRESKNVMDMKMNLVGSSKAKGNTNQSRSTGYKF